jgi:hypothetical protein
MTARLEIEEKRSQILTDNMKEQLDVQQAQVERLRAIAAFQRRQVESMVVRAGASGVLQELPMQVGQWAISGPRWPRSFGREAQGGTEDSGEPGSGCHHRPAGAIDTRNGIVKGHVVRMDPASQNGNGDGGCDARWHACQRGRRPDLSVDGTIEIERLSDVLHVGRPAYGQANSKVGIFRMVPGSRRGRTGAGRTGPELGEYDRGPAWAQEGDVVILSDMSRWGCG